MAKVDYLKGTWRFYEDDAPEDGHTEPVAEREGELSFQLAAILRKARVEGMTHGWLEFPGLSVAEVLTEIDR